MKLYKKLLETNMRYMPDNIENIATIKRKPDFVLPVSFLHPLIGVGNRKLF